MINKFNLGRVQDRIEKIVVNKSKKFGSKINSLLTTGTAATLNKPVLCVFEYVTC